MALTLPELSTWNRLVGYSLHMSIQDASVNVGYNSGYMVRLIFSSDHADRPFHCERIAGFEDMLR